MVGFHLGESPDLWLVYRGRTMSEGGGARITRLAPRVPPVWIQPQLKQRSGILGLNVGEGRRMACFGRVGIIWRGGERGRRRVRNDAACAVYNASLDRGDD